MHPAEYKHNNEVMKVINLKHTLQSTWPLNVTGNAKLIPKFIGKVFILEV